MYYLQETDAKKQESGGEALTVEQYILIAKKMGFSVAELEFFDVGGVIDVAYEYAADSRDEREASQADFDSF